MSSPAWEALVKHHKTLVTVHMRDLFLADPERFSQFSIQVGDVLLDYSKQRITTETLGIFCALAEELQLPKQIEALFAGGIVNMSEQRPALHTALRDPSLVPIAVDGQDIKPNIQKVLARMEGFVDAVRSGRYPKGCTKPIIDIISLGIGGSDLGPSMVCQALKNYKTSALNLHFVSNVDGNTLADVLAKCDPSTTLCIINSKTFTTPETLQNANSIKAWFCNALGVDAPMTHLVGITANPARAEAFGIAKDNIFEFWDFVGGRYSVWSSVGLPIALSLGMSHFRAFLKGAHAMDTHFASASFLENMPVLMAFMGIWNSNFWNCSTQAIIPYDDGLRQFSDYLQQLEMESNGKSARFDKGFVPFTTVPVIWGGVGCNGQHAYMQLLHQGTQVIPVDFLIAANGNADFPAHHQLLLASCFAQSKALMEGSLGIVSDPLIDAKRCLGNRPSNTLLYPILTPEVLGSLIALYEHKVFVQGILWGINSFDQWGVELGKKLVNQLLPYLEEGKNTSELDSSSKGLIEFLARSKTLETV